MEKYRVCFENNQTGEIDFVDLYAYGPTDAKERWKNGCDKYERGVLEFCGSFKTPSRLFTVEDFS